MTKLQVPRRYVTDQFLYALTLLTQHLFRSFLLEQSIIYRIKLRWSSYEALQTMDMNHNWIMRPLVVKRLWGDCCGRWQGQMFFSPLHSPFRISDAHWETLEGKLANDIGDGNVVVLQSSIYVYVRVCQYNRLGCWAAAAGVASLSRT